MATRLIAVNESIGGFVRRIRSSSVRKRYGRNAAFSICETVAVPALQLISTPILVKALGLEIFGLMMLITSLVGMSGIVNLGIGDATVRFVSLYRGRGESTSVARSIQTSCTVSLVLAVIAGGVLFLCSTLFVDLLLQVPIHLHDPATIGFQLGAFMFAAQLVESAFIGAVHGLERYDLSSLMTFLTRGTITAAWVIIALHGGGLKAILGASLSIMCAALVMKGVLVYRLIGTSPLTRHIDWSEMRNMFHFGAYSWLQSMAGALFSHADRIIVGAWLGMSSLAVYSVCLQLAQPIHVIASAGFSVLFPVISRRAESVHKGVLIREARLMMILNVGIALVLTLSILTLGDTILSVWIGPEVVNQGSGLLKLLACAFFVLSLNVALHYILLGLGDVRFVSFTNIAGGGMSILVTVGLIPFIGISAAALGRVIYGIAVSANFYRVVKLLR